MRSRSSRQLGARNRNRLPEHLGLEPLVESTWSRSNHRVDVSSVPQRYRRSRPPRRELSRGHGARYARCHAALQVVDALTGISSRALVVSRRVSRQHDRGLSTNIWIQLVRPAGSQADDVNLIYDLKSSQVTVSRIADEMAGSPTRRSGCASRFALPNNWRARARSAVKIPIDGSRLAAIDGPYRLGVQASLQRLRRASRLYLRSCGSLLRGRRVTRPTGLASDSHDRRRIRAQADRAHQSQSAGLRRARACIRTTRPISKSCSRISINRASASVIASDPLHIIVGITENLQNVNNTPDIGFQFGFHTFRTWRDVHEAVPVGDQCPLRFVWIGRV